MKLQEVFAQVLREPLETITEDASPRTLASWNSLRHVELVMALEAAFSVTFSTSEIMALNSFASVRDTLREKGVSV